MKASIGFPTHFLVAHFGDRALDRLLIRPVVAAVGEGFFAQFAGKHESRVVGSFGIDPGFEFLDVGVGQFVGLIGHARFVLVPDFLAQQAGGGIAGDHDILMFVAAAQKLFTSRNIEPGLFELAAVADQALRFENGPDVFEQCCSSRG